MSLASNALFNLLGAGVPAVVSIATVPYVVSHLGVADYGVLMLVTAITGYFALLDINVTAASTKFIAEHHAAGNAQAVHQTATFGLLVYTAIGLVGAVLLLVFAHPLVHGVFSVPADRQATAVAAVRLAALGFLLGQVQAYLQSIPGALMRYSLSGRVEALFGTAVPLITVLLLYLGHGLLQVVMLRVVMSGVQALLLLQVLRHLLPGFRPAWPGAELRRSILGFSAFSFLSRVAALTYAHADKLIIGARVGMAALSYYSVPATLANRVMALVFRLSGVMLPHASALAAEGRHDELQRHYLQVSRYMVYLNGAIALTLAALAQPILALWLNEDFARQGAQVMVLVALAQWVDSFTNLPSLVNDGLGHPKVTGSFALARALIGLGFIWVGVRELGIEGAAWGHLMASLLMTCAFLVYVHGRTIKLPLRELVLKSYLVPMTALLVLGAGTWMLAPLALRGWAPLVAVALGVGSCYLLVAWWWVLLPEHRSALSARLRLRVAT